MGTGAEGGRQLIGADDLAAIVGVPASVFAFIEARIEELRAVRDGTRRAYRLADAAVLAGLAELMYGEGVPFRDAAATLRAARADVVARGEALIGARAVAPARPQQAIPRDAVVGTRGATPARPEARPAPSPEVAALLGELIDCVRLLEDARDAPGHRRAR